MVVISIANQKGGVAKTTTCAALGHRLAKMGQKVLLIDLDPQGNLSYACNARVDPTRTMYQVLTTDTSSRLPLSEIIQNLSQNLDIAPADMQLSVVEMLLFSNPVDGPFQLSEALKPVNYDVILIDTQPSLGLLVMNALTASDYCLIPTSADSVFGASGISELKKSIEKIQGRRFNPKLRILGILLTKYNHRITMAKSMEQYIESYVMVSDKPELQTKLFESKIRETTKVTQAQAQKKDIWEVAENSTAAKDYDALAKEIAKMLGLKGAER